MQIAFLLFDRLTTLDAIGPYEVLQRLPGADIRFVAERPGEQRDEKGITAIVADHALADVTAPDVLVVPGGFGTRPLMHTSPCSTGSVGARADDAGPPRCARGRWCWRGAGLLDDGRATRTGWRSTCSPSTAPAEASASSSPARSSPPRACRPASTWRWRSRPDRGTRGRAGDPAVDRVRPAAAVRRRVAGQGAAATGRARARRRRQERLTRSSPDAAALRRPGRRAQRLRGQRAPVLRAVRVDEPRAAAPPRARPDGRPRRGPCAAPGRPAPRARRRRCRPPTRDTTYRGRPPPPTTSSSAAVTAALTAGSASGSATRTQPSGRTANAATPRHRPAARPARRRRRRPPPPPTPAAARPGSARDPIPRPAASAASAAPPRRGERAQRDARSGRGAPRPAHDQGVEVDAAVRGADPASARARPGGRCARSRCAMLIAGKSAAGGGPNGDSSGCTCDGPVSIVPSSHGACRCAWRRTKRP